MVERVPRSTTVLPTLLFGIFITATLQVWLHSSLIQQYSIDTLANNYHDFTTATSPTAAEDVSACLYVMDDNHSLIEWLAYHYHVVTLRHVIITSDPDSKTRPTKILNRWQNRITFEEWGDNQFLPSNFESIVEEKRWTVANITKQEKSLQHYIGRQAAFHLECLRSFKRENRSWVLLLDIDEYITVNTKVTNNEEIAIEQPNSVSKVLQQMVIPNPEYEELTTPCIPLHRKQFSARESSVDKVNHLVPPDFDALHFQTLRWRKYGYNHEVYATKWGVSCPIRRSIPNKVAIDLSRLRLIDIDRPDNSGNPHRPLAFCSRKNIYLDEQRTPFVVHHYMGTEEQWFHRSSDKRGTGFRKARYEDFNSKVGVAETDAIRPWLKGFVDTMGKELASRLLSGVGSLEVLPGKVGSPIDVPIAFQQDDAYQVGDIVQANYKGDGYWFWAEISAVLSGGFYNVIYASDCSEEIATYGGRLRREGMVDADEDIGGIDFKLLQKSGNS
mmetsp:Transcript_18631/g.40344  ORF Transcript_18631/g.40344 Transcript_18631/m.40344 type:complete len:500 (+) Transcript_18631:53-1552(+)